MALYHTYRPQTFDDVLGQPHIVAVLQSALKHDRVGHAYLFSGPRGVGKTSIARILAKAINCEKRVESRELRVEGVPCNQCQACKSIIDGSALDVIEIDAASNRGIDEIRQLRDRVRFAPTSLVKKVYIIDEVHMLTKEAFNALLKTLEEPPAHAVFVLASTELQKIPDTILSRCQHFHFRRAAPEALGQHLSAIASHEDRTIEPEALDLIVLRAEGSYRDALSAFEQLLMASEPVITADAVRALFGLPAEQQGLAVLAAIAEGNRHELLTVLAVLASEGTSFEAFATELIRIVRLLVLLATLGSQRLSGGSTLLRTAAPKLLECFSTDELVTLLERLAHVTGEMRLSPIPSLPLELALLTEAGKRVTEEERGERRGEGGDPTAVVSRTGAAQQAVESMSVLEQESITLPKQAAATSSNELDAAQNTSVDGQSMNHETSPNPATEIGPEQWQAIRQGLASQNKSLAMLIADLKLPKLTGSTLTFEVPYKFHADRLRSVKSHTMLMSAVSQTLGNPVEIAWVVNPALRTRSGVSADETVIDDPVSALSEL